MNPALHITYDSLLLAVAARRNRVDATTGAHDFSTGDLVTLGIVLSDAMEDAWNRPRGKNWVWPFLVSSATLTVTSGVIALADISYGPWFSLWSADPRPQSSTAYRVPVRLHDSSGIYPADSLASVFGLYMPRAPEFSSSAWAASTAYDAGAVRYHSASGICYRAKIDVPDTAIAITNTTYWEEMLIPREFYTFLVETAQAEYYRAAGQISTAENRDASAKEALENEYVAARNGPTGSGNPWTTGGIWR